MNQSFTLKCDNDELGDVEGYVVNNTGLGLALHFDGYSDHCSADNTGIPVYLEKYEGELRVLVYADINQEEPTHVISLEGAHVTKRNESVEPTAVTTESPVAAYFKASQVQRIIDINMTDFFDYDVTDEVSEWAWIEQYASYDFRGNGESGINDYILNLANDFDDIPGGFLAELIETARANNVHYILFNQGC
ncbi:hypothetical protein GCM10011607_11860 [Shewanella inventionis]|uniref:Uncharacterized protein n=1 Tax=Shewanella inventionis TaxID=1738770 RepID=A0ABQ1IXM9_9GAMM|nr:hypothetical protein [Shewanella inventionis]GGB52987.1 hypothetical protein GCM10011607_11860 [Shewanella inventionis]